MLRERSQLCPHLRRPLPAESSPCPAPRCCIPASLPAGETFRLPYPRVALLVARGQRCDRGPAWRSQERCGAPQALRCPAVPGHPPAARLSPRPGLPCAHGRARLGWARQSWARQSWARRRRCRRTMPSLPFPCKTAPTPDRRKVSSQAPGQVRAVTGASSPPMARDDPPPPPRPVHVPTPRAWGCRPRRSPSCTAWKGLLASMSLME